jgi:peroxiredoxin Q/BCP
MELEMPLLVEGDRAPDFTLPSDGGGSVSLKALKGKTVVLYFYPKDDTPSCTREAVDFTARLADFRKAGAEVVGVSKDSPKKHDKFKAKHKLALTLGADEDGTVVESYGVWGEKQLYGRKYMGVERATFLIDGKGVVRRTWRNVRVPGHVDEVLAAARAL